MEKNKKLKILLPVLIVIIIFVWARVFKTPASKRGAREEPGSLEIALYGDELLSFVATAKQKRAKTSYNSWGGNPFILQLSSKTITKLILNGIVWDKVTPRAIISNDIVRIGDKIGNNTVVDIKQDRVILNDGTSNFELRLGQEKW